MSQVKGKYIKNSEDEIVSLITSINTVVDSDGKDVETLINELKALIESGSNIPVNPQDTSNINIWIETQ